MLGVLAGCFGNVSTSWVHVEAYWACIACWVSWMCVQGPARLGCMFSREFRRVGRIRRIIRARRVYSSGVYISGVSGVSGASGVQFGYVGRVGRIAPAYWARWAHNLGASDV
jgi:hypothetical protein